MEEKNSIDKKLQSLRPYLRAIVFDQFENFYCRLHVLIPKSWVYDQMKEENLVLKYENIDNNIFLVLGVDNNKYSDLRVDTLLEKLYDLIDLNKKEAKKQLILQKRMEQLEKMTLEEIQSLTLPDIVLNDDDLAAYDLNNAVIAKYKQELPFQQVQPVEQNQDTQYFHQQAPQQTEEVGFQPLYQGRNNNVGFQQAPQQPVQVQQYEPPFRNNFPQQQFTEDAIQFNEFDEKVLYKSVEIVPDTPEEQLAYYHQKNMMIMKGKGNNQIESPDMYFSRRDNE